MTTQSSMFIDRLYNETLHLLNEARSYITFAERTNEKLATNARLRVSYETLRVTARLSQVMTWLLTEKAVHSGEIPADQARGDGFAIYGGDFCTEESTLEDKDILPEGLQSLLDRTLSLYQRALRLEDILKQAAS